MTIKYSLKNIKKKEKKQAITKLRLCAPTIKTERNHGIDRSDYLLARTRG